MTVCRAGRAGMTLIEILVAMTIGSIVIAAVLAVFSTAQRQQEEGERRSDLFQSVRVALNRVQDDLTTTVHRASEADFAFVATSAKTDGRPTDVLEFTTLSAAPLPAVITTGDAVRVQYSLADPDDPTHRGLLREAHALPLPEEATPEQGELSVREYCPSAVGLDLTYYDPTAQDWVEEWEQASLPSAVRVVLYVLPEPPKEGAEVRPTDLMPFSTVVHLALSDVPLGEGQPEGAEVTTTMPTGAETSGLLPTEGLPGGSLPELPGLPNLPPEGGGER